MTARVEASTNLFDFFNDHIGEAKARAGVRLSDDTTLYLVTLLTERARSDRPAPPETTLAELHGRAAHAPPAEQARTYRELGDTALYLLGYFEESLDRRLVGPAYYRDMGTAAYERVDLLLKRFFADAFGPVFRELADKFQACVELLVRVRDIHAAQHPDRLMALYRTWLQTGSGQAAARLRELGVIVPQDGGEN